MSGEGSRIQVEPGRLNIDRDAQPRGLFDRLAAHEIGMRDTRPGRRDRHRLVDLIISVEQGVNRPVADAVGRELQARRDRFAHDRAQTIGRNEQHAAVARVVDRVNLAHAPGLAHVGAAGEHAAVQDRS